MINLICNELIKIRHKKGPIICLSVFMILVIFMNWVNSKYASDFVDMDINYGYDNVSRLDLEYELSYYDLNNLTDVSGYVNTKSRLDVLDVADKYDKKSWQYIVCDKLLYNYYYDLYLSKYFFKDDAQVKEAQNKINNILSKLNDGDWKYFVNLDIEETKKEIANFKKDNSSTNNLSEEILRGEIDLEILNYRLENDVPYGYDYLNKALDDYKNNKVTITMLDKDKLSNREKEELDEAKEGFAIAKYIMDNKVDINSYDNARLFSAEYISTYNFMFVIFIIVVTGSLMSDEFNKGTIKGLLLKPYTRTKIFFAKYITSLIILVIGVTLLVLTQYIAAGVFFGFDSYKIPMVVYNFATGNIIEISIIKYIFEAFLAILPMLILILTLSYSLSTIFLSAALAIGVPIFGMSFAAIFNQLVVMKEIKYLYYFPTMVWDLTSIMYGRKSEIVPFSMPVCIIICVIYLIIMLVVSCIVFNKRNVKNI